MLNDTEIRGEYQENYRYAHDFWVPYTQDCLVHTLAASGYTWSDQERLDLIKEGREPLEFNIMRRPLQFYSGYLRDNIKSVVYAPVEGSDQQTADQFTKLGDYIWDKGGGFPTFLEGCDEGLKSGLALVGLQMDYSRDFVHGDITFFKRVYNQFFLDPMFSQIDLKDCAFAITRDLLSKEHIKQLIPFVDPKEIDHLQYAFRDDKFLTYHPQFTNFARNRNIIAYDQYYKRVVQERTFLVDMDSSFYRDITDLPPDEKRQLRVGIKRFDLLREEAEIAGNSKIDIPNVEIRIVNRDFVELNIMLNGHRVWCGEDKTGINHTYPFVPILCYFEPSIWMPSQRIQGIAASQYWNQRQFNKRHMKIINMMDSDISTGFKYLIGSVPDPLDLQQTGQNRIIGVDPEATGGLGLGAVEQLHGGGANPALMEYQAILDKLSMTLANINETMLGVDEKGNTQVSGRLAEVRLAQGLRGNRKVFDQIETSQQLLGGLLLVAMQKNLPPGKIKRILNEEPTEQFYNKEFEQFDAIIKEGIKTKSQKDAYYYELINLKKEGIVDVPSAEIIRALQMSGISDLEKAMQQQDEQLQQVQALEAQRIKAELEEVSSRKEANLGLAQERKARVISDLSLKDERESEAVENLANAALERARAITEIAKLNEDRIIQVLSFINQMENAEEIKKQQQKIQVGNEAHSINAETEGSAENKVIQSPQQEV
jgi:hypothetical protein